jgi:hypothetical protein
MGCNKRFNQIGQFGAYELFGYAELILNEAPFVVLSKLSFSLSNFRLIGCVYVPFIAFSALRPEKLKQRSGRQR